MVDNALSDLTGAGQTYNLSSVIDLIPRKFPDLGNNVVSGIIVHLHRIYASTGFLDDYVQLLSFRPW